MGVNAASSNLGRRVSEDGNGERGSNSWFFLTDLTMFSRLIGVMCFSFRTDVSEEPKRDADGRDEASS
jgi:hypothetical protein